MSGEVPEFVPYLMMGRLVRLVGIAVCITQQPQLPINVVDVGSATFGNPIFQKVLQN